MDALQVLAAGLFYCLLTCTAGAASPACSQQGVTATFYTLNAGQSSYLAGQFPFITGAGSLLDSRSPDAVVLNPQVNLANAGTTLPGIAADELKPWPPGFSAASSVAALFDTQVTVRYSGFWTMYVRSSSTFEMTLSSVDGKGQQAIKAGDQPFQINSTLEGTVLEAQYNLTQGIYSIHIEWHWNLPGDPPVLPLLVLEWSFASDPAQTPSPSGTALAREIIPASALTTSCQSLSPLQPPMSPGPALSPPPFVAAPPANPSPPPPPPSGSLAAACSVVNSISNSWTQGGMSYLSVNMYLSATGAAGIAVPYIITLTNPAYVSITPFNYQVLSIADGVIKGNVSASWAGLLPESGNSINVGGVIVSTGGDSIPQTFTINGVACMQSSA